MSNAGTDQEVPATWVVVKTATGEVVFAGTESEARIFRVMLYSTIEETVIRG